MNLDVQFLFDNQLISELESLIKNSKNELLLISPFIDLDRRIMDALKEKIKNPKFKLRVLFGKNEKNIYKSVKKDSFEFLKQFPDIEIRYEARLHAKFYMNDNHYIMTSMNLYDYSLANNIESGIKVLHASQGFLGKVADGFGDLVEDGIDKIKNDVLGMGNNGINPVIKFNAIFENAILKYKTESILKEGGILSKKKLDGFNVLIDELVPQNKNNSFHSNSGKPAKKTSDKFLSATNLGKPKGKSFNQVVEVMVSKNYIEDKETITSEGEKAGVQFKQNAKGTKWIVYPESLAEIL
jgi:hypothetical protein